ncbi:MAG: hypothetical protein LUE93_16985 [Bacteroides sp.]|nr:hypothetical protein [Bacteroides sp.]
MSLKFQCIELKLLSGEHAGETRYFGRVRCEQKITFDQLCKQISLLSTATKGGVELILDSFVEVMSEQLSLGNILQLGDLGNFRLSAGSRGVDPEEEFQATDMRKPRIIFSPGKMLQEATDAITFEKLNSRVIKECPYEH